MTAIFRSTCWGPGPLYGCLKEADQKLGPNRQWTGNTPEQDSFLRDLGAGLEGLSLLLPDEFKTKLSDDSELLNRWSEENGFDLWFDPFS